MNTADQFKSARHTPGPWSIERTSRGTFIESIGPLSTQEYAGSSWIDVSEADALLIAAAPELLAELGKADLIISVLLNALSTEQKSECAAKIEDLRIHGAGMTRARERDAILRKASGVPT